MAFSPAHVRRLEQWGRAAFLAAVSLLQEFDYECATDCQRAANLHRMLDGLTGIGALVVQPIAAEPTPVDTCRFAAVAAGWRRFDPAGAAWIFPYPHLHRLT